MTDAVRRPQRALVVDDDVLLRTMLGDALRERGFEVLTAETGQQGLELLLDELLALDVLVTDLRMPQMDGEALVQRVRVAGGERDLVIVVISGRGPPPPARFAGVSVDALVDKAIGPQGIALAVEAAIDRRRSSAAAVPPDTAADQGQVLSVSYGSAAELLADAQMLSASGVFVRGAALALGSEATLHLVLPNGAVLRGPAQVVRVEHDGVGVKFTLEPADRERLAALLDRAWSAQSTGKISASPFRELWRSGA